ncbi:MAG: hypothetical protein RLZZ350_1177 [Verrucomicrobiota bacterium]|jgi:hypothetical protein
MFSRALCFSLTLLASHLFAATFYIALTGNDTNSGTTTNLAWRTIQKAANTLAPGDTALVRSGVYSEAVTVNVSGNAGSFVTFQNFPGEQPIVDGATVPVPSVNGGLFTLLARSNVTVAGFEIRNYRTNALHVVPAGIWIGGGAHDISILSNNIHHIENTNANADGAYGLVAYGDSTATISNLVIRANELHHLKTAWSESMALDGNVSDFEVSSNRVHDNWNIGILMAGWYGTCPVTNLDRARHGVCRDNTVWNCSTASNPNYGSPSCAGIYCDGSTDIIVERNQSFQNDIGLEFATENKGKPTDHILARNNLVWSNGMGGIFIGGYDTKRGRTELCTITHNTLFHNDTLGWGQGEFMMQFDTRSNIFTHNLLIANDTAVNLLVCNTSAINTNNTLDWNLYFAPGGASAAQWKWKNTARTSFATWKSVSTNDANSLFADPQFINAAGTNFHLATNSPAVNAGATNFTADAGETDFDFQPRVSGGRTDLGADELGALAPVLGFAAPANGVVQLTLTGEPGHTFVWEKSAALTNWQPLATNFADGGSLLLTSSVAAPAGFFRAKLVQ